MSNKTALLSCIPTVSDIVLGRFIIAIKYVCGNNERFISYLNIPIAFCNAAASFCISRCFLAEEKTKELFKTQQSF